MIVNVNIWIISYFIQMILMRSILLNTGIRITDPLLFLVIRWLSMQIVQNINTISKKLLENI